MTKPNIFNFATSELSQDAVIAYMLDWANPEYCTDDPKLNKLGEDFLRTLLAETEGKPIGEITELCVLTQYEGIDVYVKINNSVHLIIEDKVDTKHHSNQIERYKEKLKKKFKNSELDIRSIYIKTGNESANSRPKNADRYFLRKDFLELLNRHTKTNNNIIDEFRAHLQSLEDETQNFRSEKFSEWSWYAHQGYYLALGEKFKEANWGYAPNPSGGPLVFWWHIEKYHAGNCNIYLQIDQHKGLFIRAGDAKDNHNKDVKVSVNLLRELLGKAEESAKRLGNIQVEKPARLGVGWTANFARIYFDGDKNNGAGSYLATEQDGIIKFECTVARLKIAENLVKMIAKK